MATSKYGKSHTYYLWWPTTQLGLYHVVLIILVALFSTSGDNRLICFDKSLFSAFEASSNIAVVRMLYLRLDISACYMLHAVHNCVSQNIIWKSKCWVHRPSCANNGPNVHDLKGGSGDHLTAPDISSEDLIPCWLLYLEWLMRFPSSMRLRHMTGSKQKLRRWFYAQAINHSNTSCINSIPKLCLCNPASETIPTMSNYCIGRLLDSKLHEAFWEKLLKSGRTVFTWNNITSLSRLGL